MVKMLHQNSSAAGATTSEEGPTVSRTNTGNTLTPNTSSGSGLHNLEASSSTVLGSSGGGATSSTQAGQSSSQSPPQQDWSSASVKAKASLWTRPANELPNGGPAPPAGASAPREASTGSGGRNNIITQETIRGRRYTASTPPRSGLQLAASVDQCGAGPEQGALTSTEPPPQHFNIASTENLQNKDFPTSSRVSVAPPAGASTADGTSSPQQIALEEVNASAAAEVGLQLLQFALESHVGSAHLNSSSESVLSEVEKAELKRKLSDSLLQIDGQPTQKAAHKFKSQHHSAGATSGSAASNLFVNSNNASAISHNGPHGEGPRAQGWRFHSPLRNRRDKSDGFLASRRSNNDPNSGLATSSSQADVDMLRARGGGTRTAGPLHEIELSSTMGQAGGESQADQAEDVTGANNLLLDTQDRCDLLPTCRDYLAKAVDILNRKTPVGRCQLMHKVSEGLSRKHFIPKELDVSEDDLRPESHMPAMTPSSRNRWFQVLNDHPEDFWAPLPIFVRLGAVIPQGEDPTTAIQTVETEILFSADSSAELKTLLRKAMDTAELEQADEQFYPGEELTLKGDEEMMSAALQLDLFQRQRSAPAAAGGTASSSSATSSGASAVQPNSTAAGAAGAVHQAANTTGVAAAVAQQLQLTRNRTRSLPLLAGEQQQTEEQAVTDAANALRRELSIVPMPTSASLLQRFALAGLHQGHGLLRRHFPVRYGALLDRRNFVADGCQYVADHYFLSAAYKRALAQLYPAEGCDDEAERLPRVAGTGESEDSGSQMHNGDFMEQPEEADIEEMISGDVGGPVLGDAVTQTYDRSTSPHTVAPGLSQQRDQSAARAAATADERSLCERFQNLGVSTTRGPHSVNAGTPSDPDHALSDKHVPGLPSFWRETLWCVGFKAFCSLAPALKHPTVTKALQFTSEIPPPPFVLPTKEVGKIITTYKFDYARQKESKDAPEETGQEGTEVVTVEGNGEWIFERSLLYGRTSSGRQQQQTRSSRWSSYSVVVNPEPTDKETMKIAVKSYLNEDPSRKIYLYVHGGAFLGASAANVRLWTYNWAKQSKIVLFAVDYRKPPFNGVTLKDSVADVYEGAWKQYLLKDCGIAPDRIILWGDSAGASLVVWMLARIAKNAAAKEQEEAEQLRLLREQEAAAAIAAGENEQAVDKNAMVVDAGEMLTAEQASAKVGNDQTAASSGPPARLPESAPVFRGGEASDSVLEVESSQQQSHQASAATAGPAPASGRGKRQPGLFVFGKGKKPEEKVAPAAVVLISPWLNIDYIGEHSVVFPGENQVNFEAIAARGLDVFEPSMMTMAASTAQGKTYAQQGQHQQTARGSGSSRPAPMLQDQQEESTAPAQPTGSSATPTTRQESRLSMTSLMANFLASRRGAPAPPNVTPESNRSPDNQHDSHSPRLNRPLRRLGTSETPGPLSPAALSLDSAEELIPHEAELDEEADPILHAGVIAASPVFRHLQLLMQIGGRELLIDDGIDFWRKLRHVNPKNAANYRLEIYDATHAHTPFMLFLDHALAKVALNRATEWLAKLDKEDQDDVGAMAADEDGEQTTRAE
ncbi:unnamed protein product [Amoebophrya sp. A120]|nr:unnamed protein product [Amoebophrya sp. A120]|eukprot:GSA120T00012931001.1